MCGFAGFVGEVENREQVLENMMDTIIHRGPDSSGKFVDEDAALGFRRLSIIDLSESGDQPLYNEDRSKVLVFNGEIYNYQELREELIQAGHTFAECMHLQSGIKRQKDCFQRGIFLVLSRFIMRR